MFYTLLLNSTGECISFLSERKALKLIAKEKVNILSKWDEEFGWGRSQKMQYPAVAQLKHRAPWIPRKKRFNRFAVFKRDKYICQYCNKPLEESKLTLDHLVPRFQGGKNGWKNCVTACFNCNNQKGARTPEQAEMKLLQNPSIPGVSIIDDYLLINKKHPDWKFFLGV